METIKRKLPGLLEISLGVFLLDLGFYFFFTPTNLITGGAMGLSLILKDVLPFSSSIFLYIFNITTLILGLVLLGKEFFLKTVYASLLLPVVIGILEVLIPNYTSMTNDQTIDAIAYCFAVNIVWEFAFFDARRDF